MNSGATAERVYEAIKRQIMGRAFRPGEKLDPAVLADGLASSVTPVRDALHVLTGEGLVGARTREGFHLPLLDQPGLSDLYGWNSEVLVLAIRAWPAQRPDLQPPLSNQEWSSAADVIASLFSSIAALSSNAEHRKAVSALNARLHAVRTVEPRILADTAEEIGAVEAALGSLDVRQLRALVTRYHRRRQQHAAAIVRAAYRAD